MMAEHNQQFKSFDEWVSKASSWLTRHPDFSEEKHNVFRAICFDAQGRLCRIGADFARARDEDAFPVHWLWPDQVPEVVALLKSSFLIIAQLPGDHTPEQAEMYQKIIAFFNGDKQS